MKCPTCGSMLHTENIGGKFFVVCKGPCAGAGKFGTPISNGKESPAEAERDGAVEIQKKIEALRAEAARS